jgi:cell division septation protein DedD
MRGSTAESRSRNDGSKNDGVVRGAMDYSLKPSNQGERAASTGARRAGVQSASAAGEVRLGKLQVVVWLGLALGAIVGSYFVGFFSGRYVGFESARESSAGEMAKLPAPEAFEQSSTQNPRVVYDKLTSPAILEAGENRGGGARQQGLAQGSQPSADGRDQRVEELVKEAAKPESVSAAMAGSQDVGDVDEMFAESVAGTELIIGSDEGLGTSKVPESIRMLGSGRAPAAKEVEVETQKAASALIDERIAKARSDSSKSVGVDASGPEKKAPEANSAQASSLVRKVVPSGYFAQVAAPKKLSEAEGVANKLKRSGFPVLVESASVAGQNFYRVLVGPEQNKVQADRLVGQLKGESYIQGDPFIRKVK